jgi:hypothetical protein
MSLSFHEVQRFRQVWVWALVLLISGMMWVAFVRQLLQQHPFGDRPMPDFLLIAYWVFFGIGLPALFLFGKLVTEVREDGVYIKFFPFHWHYHKICFSDLKTFGIQTYQPIKDFGGWGIRYGGTAKAYTVSGNQGVQLTLLSGRHIMLGSQQPTKLHQGIQAGYTKHQTAHLSKHQGCHSCG